MAAIHQSPWFMRSWLHSEDRPWEPGMRVQHFHPTYATAKIPTTRRPEPQPPTRKETRKINLFVPKPRTVTHKSHHSEDSGIDTVDSSDSESEASYSSSEYHYHRVRHEISSVRTPRDYIPSGSAYITKPAGWEGESSQQGGARIPGGYAQGSGSASGGINYPRNWGGGPPNKKKHQGDGDDGQGGKKKKLSMRDTERLEPCSYFLADPTARKFQLGQSHYECSHKGFAKASQHNDRRHPDVTCQRCGSSHSDTPQARAKHEQECFGGITAPDPAQSESNAKGKGKRCYEWAESFEKYHGPDTSDYPYADTYMKFHDAMHDLRRTFDFYAQNDEAAAAFMQRFFETPYFVDFLGRHEVMNQFWSNGSWRHPIYDNNWHIGFLSLRTSWFPQSTPAPAPTTITSPMNPQNPSLEVSGTGTGTGTEGTGPQTYQPNPAESLLSPVSSAQGYSGARTASRSNALSSNSFPATNHPSSSQHFSSPRQVLTPSYRGWGGWSQDQATASYANELYSPPPQLQGSGYAGGDSRVRKQASPHTRLRPSPVFKPQAKTSGSPVRTPPASTPPYTNGEGEPIKAGAPHNIQQRPLHQPTNLPDTPQSYTSPKISTQQMENMHFSRHARRVEGFPTRSTEKDQAGTDILEELLGDLARGSHSGSASVKQVETPASVPGNSAYPDPQYTNTYEASYVNYQPNGAPSKIYPQSIVSMGSSVQTHRFYGGPDEPHSHPQAATHTTTFEASFEKESSGLYEEIQRKAGYDFFSDPNAG